MPWVLRRSFLEHGTMAGDATADSFASDDVHIVLSGAACLRIICADIDGNGNEKPGGAQQNVAAGTAFVPACSQHGCNPDAQQHSLICLKVPLAHLYSILLSTSQLSQHDVLAAMQDCHELACLPDAARQVLLQHAAVQHHNASTTLMSAGDVAHVAMLVLQGACSQLCDAARICGRLSGAEGSTAKAEIAVATQRAGEAVGMASCRHGMPMWADVKTVTQATVLAIPKAALQEAWHSAQCGRAAVDATLAHDLALRHSAVAALADALHSLRLTHLQLDAAAEASLRRVQSQDVPMASIVAALPFPAIPQHGQYADVKNHAAQSAEVSKLRVGTSAAQHAAVKGSVGEVTSTKGSSGPIKSIVLASAQSGLASGTAASETAAGVPRGSAAHIPEAMLADVLHASRAAERSKRQQLSTYDGCSIHLQEAGALHVRMPADGHSTNAAGSAAAAGSARPITTEGMCQHGQFVLPDAERLAQYYDNPLDIGTRMIAQDRAPAVEVHAAQAPEYYACLRHPREQADDISGDASSWHPVLDEVDNAARATEVCPRPPASSVTLLSLICTTGPPQIVAVRLWAFVARVMQCRNAAGRCRLYRAARHWLSCIRLQ